MSSSQKNPLLEFFASVQLALFLLFLLAGTSIIGTIIPQNAQPGLYLEKYGPVAARFFELLDIGDMYNSWWFLSLLALFTTNLIVCSLERIPRVIRLLKRDNLAATPEQLGRFGLKRSLDSSLPATELAALTRGFFKEQGWKSQARAAGGEGNRDSSTLLFAEKTPWSRFGVYVVHASILVILAGAVLGSPSFARKVLRQDNFAYKGFVMLPEQASTDHIRTNRGNMPVNLGFTLRCDHFHIDFYDNGMPKTYRSLVTILEDGKEVLQREIVVNKPLKYKGVTFYQSSYQPYPDYTLQLSKKPENITLNTTIAPGREMRWDEGGLTYGIINWERQGEVTRRLKLWLYDGEGEASQLWVDMNRETVIERPSGQYVLTIKQVYATGLQAAKDPGVWLVYLGCALMLVGLYIAFFLSHRKLFAYVEENGAGSRLLLAGTANKNKVHFDSLFNRMADKLAQRASSPQP
ncbi:MAG: cytochrome c biogenesis protein ResB [bacterium]|nr:cytochrome c biogenesis protein ResB [bacterium]